MGCDKGQIYQRGNRFFYQIWWNGKAEQFWSILIYGKWQAIKSWETADKVKKAICTEIDRDPDGFDPRSFRPCNPLSLGVYYKKWLEEIDVETKTRRDYRTALEKYAIPFFTADKDIRKFKKAELTKFLKSLADKSQDYQFNVMGALRTMVRWAYSNEEIKFVPPFPSMSKNDSADIEYLTLEQQEKVLACIPAEHQGIFRLAMEYGLRVGEVRAIKKDAIKDGKLWIKRRFAENELKDGTKTPLKKIEVRSYAITPYAKEVIYQPWDNASEFVFSRADAKPYTNKNLNAIWRDGCEKANIRIKMYNAFRHSLGCQLLDEGRDLSFVQEVLGHKRQEMTKRYAKRTAKRIGEVLSLRRNTCHSFAIEKNEDKQAK